MNNSFYEVEEDDGFVNVQVIVTGRAAVDIAGRYGIFPKIVYQLSLLYCWITFIYWPSKKLGQIPHNYGIYM